MWLIPWARFFTAENLLIATLVRHEELVAVAPLYSWRQHSQINLLLLGNGISDYLDICVHPGFRREVALKFSGWLNSLEHAKSCEFHQLPAGSVLRHLPEGQRIESAGEVCPVLELGGKSFDSYAPAEQLEKLHYYRRRARKLGTVIFQKATGSDAEQLLQELFRLHHIRWTRKGESGVLQDDLTRQFHLQAALQFAETGFLRLYALKLNGQVIAVLYALADSQATYFYLSGFDPEFEKLSPGTLLIGHAIEEALSERHRTFNFLRGREPYKYRWGALDQETFSCTYRREQDCRAPS